MAADATVNELSLSPPDSGRESPVKRPSRRQVEDETLRPDKNFRRYASNVERALSLFDSALQEWADYISFLGRLLKAIQSHPPAVDILPHNAAVAKSLAQCLNSSLPSGVHQKAIEVYAYVFSLIGKQRLSRDLSIYLPGLTPVLSFASLSVRPYFLALAETHLISLDAAALRPALKAMLLGFMPGLEEETSEDFERTLRIFDNLKIAVNEGLRVPNSTENIPGDEYFWQCLFLAIITSPSKRLGGLNLLTKRLPSFIANEKTSADTLSVDLETLILPEPGLLIRCFVAGLTDEQLLIQRGFLDLLVSRLPLNSPVLTNRVDATDLQLLVAAATGVVARRDMSLNRRLWFWFLGVAPMETHSDSNEVTSPGEEKPNPAIIVMQGSGSYFSQYGTEPLIKAMLSMFLMTAPTPAGKARPFRICLSLMDRTEIGTVIASEVFLPAMESLAAYKEASSEEEFSDVLRSASGFFDSVESKLIWNQLQRSVMSSLQDIHLDEIQRLEKLDLAKFIITTFNVREEDMFLLHMPLLFVTIIILVNNHESGSSSTSLSISHKVIERILGIADLLGNALPLNVFLEPQTIIGSSGNKNSRTIDSANAIPTIQQYYLQAIETPKLVKPPFAIYQTADLLVEQTLALVERALQSESDTNTTGLRSRLLVAVLSNLGNRKNVYGERILHHVKAALPFVSPEASTCRDISFSAIPATIQIIAQFLPARSTELKLRGSQLIISLIKVLWTLLSPSSPMHHVEAVRCLWQLQELSVADGLVEACIASYIGGIDDHSSDVSSQIESARRLAVLWNHTANLPTANSRKNQGIAARSVSLASEHGRVPEARELLPLLHRPLLLLLDTLADGRAERRNFTRDWLKNLTEVDSILEFLIGKLVAIVSVQTILSPEELKDRVMDLQQRNQDKSHECLNYLQHCLNFVSLASSNVHSALSRETIVDSNNDNSSKSLRVNLAQICYEIIRTYGSSEYLEDSSYNIDIQIIASSILRILLQSPDSVALREHYYDERFIELLRESTSRNPVSHSLHLAFMDVIIPALELRLMKSTTPQKPSHQRASSLEVTKMASRLQLNTSGHDGLTVLSSPPQHLVDCIQEGISSKEAQHISENWINFLVETLPYLSSVLFRVLIPLVECLCRNIGQTLKLLQQTFSLESCEPLSSPEKVIFSQLTGLTVLLVTAHERLALEEQNRSSSRTPDQPQGFFGNVVSGVFSSDLPKGRIATANTRLTVLLSFQDAIQKCLAICAWGSRRQRDLHADPSSAASLGYLAQRLRNKARRLLDRLFALEPLESLETFIVHWTDATYGRNPTTPSIIMRILHVLDATKPKAIISAIFNSIYSRTNPDALEPARVSTLTSDLTDTDLVTFLLEYTRSLDDDTMDEIWADCMTFMRDVLANPLPHRQILTGLVMFVPLLAQKMENTNFGEQKKTRKDLSEFFMRLLSAFFTTRSLGTTQGTPESNGKSHSSQEEGSLPEAELRRKLRTGDMAGVVAGLIPNLQMTLPENERLLNAISMLSTNLISPMITARSFPDTMKLSTLELLQSLTKISLAAKIWKKDVGDALNNAKFFSSSTSLVTERWIPIFRQWCLGDNARIPEILARIVAPTSAGIMFGVGAASARLEADKRTQLNLRRLTLLVLAADEDWAVPHMPAIEEKLTELLTATPTSSPSSLTRAELFMLIRAILLKTSSVHLSSMWPILNSELRKAIASTLPHNAHYETYQTSSLLEACKLLDLLVTISPDEFQLHEWLFITDTIDAVYVPNNFEPIALVDDLADELGLRGPMRSPKIITPASATLIDPSLRKPLLLRTSDDISTTNKEEIVHNVLRPFFTHLSFQAFEAAYGMAVPDLQSCKIALLSDIFNDTTFVS